MKSLIKYSFLFSALCLAQDEIIKIDGSSTVFPITEAVSEEFQTLKKGGIKVTVGISGTGGGFKKFCRGETDIQDASRPISKDEMALCKDQSIEYIELPIAFDAITLCVSQKNKWVTQITLAELKKMWEPDAQAKVTTWNQVRSEWPKSPIKLLGAGSDSGTFDYFTEAVNGKAKSSRGDYTASEDDNTLVLGISNDPHALGYLPYAYYESNKDKLKAVAVMDKSGKKGVLPSVQTIVNGSYTPFSRPIFIYVSKKSLSKPAVQEFSKFYISQARTLVPQVHYVPLSKSAYQMVLSHLEKGKVGTAFGGEAQIGVKIEDILKKARR